MEKKPILSLSIPKFLTKVPISKSQKPIYYSIRKGKGRKPVPIGVRRRCPNTDLEGYVLDNEGNRIIANIRSVGKPKYLRVNNQHIYSSNGYYMRLAIVNGLKDFFRPYVEQLPVITDLPLIIECEIKTTVGTGNWDIENIGTIYSKVFNDLLVTLGKIPDDSIRYITQAGSGPRFTPIESEDDREMIFSFYQDLREEIQQLNLFGSRE